MDELNRIPGVGSGADARRIAYLRQPAGAPGNAGVVWLSGLKSDMTGTKAAALAAWAAKRASAACASTIRATGSRRDGSRIARWGGGWRRRARPSGR